MKKIYLDRLKKLHKHMTKGKLGHKKFDFSRFNEDVGKNGESILTPNRCGTNGCMAGELPIIFPVAWKFSKYGMPIRKDIFELEEYNSQRHVVAVGQQNTLQQIQGYFDLDYAESEHLFFPGGQCQDYGGRYLKETSKKETVARNLEIFIQKKESKEI